jgi:hypothetical protein
MQTQSEMQKQRSNNVKKQRLVARQREEMTSNYEGRVHNFMMAVGARQMLQTPVLINDPLVVLSKSRTFKGSARLILNGFSNERQRIEREISRNQFLDVEPVLTKHSFREDDPAKRLQGRMRFGPVNTLDRLRDAAKYPNIVTPMQLEQRYVPSPGLGLPTRLTDMSRESSPAHRHAPAMSPKDIYPSLHKKTHFNAIVSSLTLQSLRATRKSSPTLPTSPQARFSKENVLKHGNFSREEAENVAQAVLESCHVKRKVSSPFLRCGCGRLVGNPDTTVGEVYSKLGNSTHSVTPVMMRAGVLV